MIVMEYVAKVIELARFSDDNVATNMAKVRRLENGLKLSIRGKILGLRLQDMGSLVGITMTIERERDRGWTEHPRCGCQWQEKGKPVVFQFGKEAKGF